MYRVLEAIVFSLCHVNLYVLLLLLLYQFASQPGVRITLSLVRRLKVVVENDAAAAKHYFDVVAHRLPKIECTL